MFYFSFPAIFPQQKLITPHYIYRVFYKFQNTLPALFCLMFLKVCQIKRRTEEKLQGLVQVLRTRKPDIVWLMSYNLVLGPLDLTLCCSVLYGSETLEIIFFNLRKFFCIMTADFWSSCLLVSEGTSLTSLYTLLYILLCTHQRAIVPGDTPPHTPPQCLAPAQLDYDHA